MIDWTSAWQRDTDTMRNDGRMIIGLGSWRGGFDPRWVHGDREQRRFNPADA